MQKNIAELGLHRSTNNKAVQVFTAYAGNQSCPVTLSRPIPQGKLDFTRISRGVASRLKIPAGSYQIYHFDRQSFYLGPVVGIFSSAIKPGGYPGRSETKINKEMIRFARKRGVFIYMFGASGVDKRSGLIEGVTTDLNDQWMRGLFPRPDIVYNRIRKRRVENKPNIIALLNQFEADPNLFMFNSRFLNKWEVYQATDGVPMVSSLFPHTMLFNRRNLEVMLNSYGQVLVKPINGSLGKGIIKIVAQSNRYYLAESSHPTKWYKYNSLDQLYNAITGKMHVSDNALLQRMVELCRYKGRIFDIRAQFQKDATGSWVTTGAAIRVARKGQFVTHIPNGGRAEDFNTVIRHVFPNPSVRAEITNQLEYISRQVPSLLEERLGFTLAIVSMDIAIDPDGKMWILEVNSKPSHFDEPEIRRRHLQLLTDYCIYKALEQKINLIERSSL